MTSSLHSGGPLVVLEDVSLTLGSAAGPVNILRGVSLEIAAGETVSLVGPSGSGKSTVMMVVGGLERPSAGRVRIDGNDLAALDENALARLRRDHIGIVFQAFHLIPTMTALENVALPLELGGRRDAFDAAARGLAAVGLDHRLTHYPGQLSGGEQQRVAIARAFIAGPRLLLADEPTGNLDAATGRLVIDSLFQHQARHGTTLLLITHDSSIADRCERQILPLLQGGYLVLADRYIYTAFARDGARGCAAHWLRNLYRFAPLPDLTFYFRAPLEVAVNRILSGRPKLKYYEAGMDLNLSNDEYESYRIFQTRIVDQYESMVQKDKFVNIDGTLDIEEQQNQMRHQVMKLLPAAKVPAVLELEKREGEIE